MTYTCDYCNYSTKRKNNLTKHLKTKKHLENVHIKDDSNKSFLTLYSHFTQTIGKSSYSCKYCNRLFNRQDNLTRHYGACIERKEVDNDLKRTILEKDKIIKETKKQNNELKHLVAYFEELLSTTTQTLDKSVTAISFANMYYANGKVLKGPTRKELNLLYHNEKYPKNKKEYLLVDEKEQLKMQSRKLYNNVSYEYAGGTKQLADYITKIIVEIYKKKDPSEQALWSSDSSRLNFIIREVLENTDKTKWQIDKKGLRVSKMIIDPLMNELKGVLEKELIISSDMMSKNGGFIRQEESRKLNRAAKIIKEIDEGILQDLVLKKIAGHFYLEKDKEKPQEDEEDDATLSDA